MHGVDVGRGAVIRRAILDKGVLVAATAGFTGADLKRLLDDGKNLYAFDRATQKPLRPLDEYFVAAVATVKDNKSKYAEAEARARQRFKGQSGPREQP